MDITYPCKKDIIEKILPHRDPFLWVSRIIECDAGKSVTAELDVSADLPLFAGHFPSYPVLPGVIIMEALAQAASFCILVEQQDRGSLGFLAGIDNAKFRQQVRPDDTLTLKAQIIKANKRMCVAEVSALVDDKLCASATQKYVLAQADSNNKTKDG